MRDPDLSTKLIRWDSVSDGSNRMSNLAHMGIAYNGIVFGVFPCGERGEEWAHAKLLAFLPTGPLKIAQSNDVQWLEELALDWLCNLHPERTES